MSGGAEEMEKVIINSLRNIEKAIEENDTQLKAALQDEFTHTAQQVHNMKEHVKAHTVDVNPRKLDTHCISAEFTLAQSTQVPSQYNNKPPALYYIYHVYNDTYASQIAETMLNDENRLNYSNYPLKTIKANNTARTLLELAKKEDELDNQ